MWLVALLLLLLIFGGLGFTVHLLWLVLIVLVVLWLVSWLATGHRL